MTARTDFAARQAGIQAARGGVRGPERAVEPREARNPSSDTRTTLTTAQSVVLSNMSEAELQKHVTDALTERGWEWWHIPDMRRVTAGLPDLLCIHPDRPLLLAYELKGPKTPITAKQAAVIAAMQRIPGVDARIIRPADWPDVLKELDS